MHLSRHKFACEHVAGVTKIRGTDELDGELEDAASPKATPGSSLKADSAGAISLADSEALVWPTLQLLKQPNCVTRSLQMMENTSDGGHQEMRVVIVIGCEVFGRAASVRVGSAS